MDYTLRELMAIIAAREIKNGDIVFCGTGISILYSEASQDDTPTPRPPGRGAASRLSSPH